MLSRSGVGRDTAQVPQRQICPQHQKDQHLQSSRSWACSCCTPSRPCRHQQWTYSVQRDAQQMELHCSVPAGSENVTYTTLTLQTAVALYMLSELMCSARVPSCIPYSNHKVLNNACIASKHVLTCICWSNCSRPFTKLTATKDRWMQIDGDTMSWLRSLTMSMQLSQELQCGYSSRSTKGCTSNNEGFVCRHPNNNEEEASWAS